MDLDEIRRKRRRLFSAGASDKDGVVGLTEDTPEPEDTTKMTDDEAYARHLQAEFDAEDGDGTQPVASSSIHSRSLSLDGTSTTPSGLNPMTTGPSVSAREIQNTLRALHASVKGHRCQQCIKSLFKSEKDVLNLFNSLMEQTTIVGSGIGCTDCQTISETGNDQVILIWTLLCGFDQSSKHNKADRKKRPRRGQPSGAGKGKGIGYGGYSRQPYKFGGIEDPDADFDDDETTDMATPIPATASAAPAPGLVQTLPGLLGYHYGHPVASKTVGGKSAVNKRSKATITAACEEDKFSDDDKMTARVLQCLTQLLPSFEKESDFDKNPPAEQLQCVLLGSSILERAADLFRNNDLEEVTNKAELYAELVSFTRALAQHTSTGVLVFGERVARSPGVSILKVSFGRADLVSKDEPDTTQSLTRCMREMALQCKTMIKSSETSQKHVETLRSIAELNDFLTAIAGAETMKSMDKNAWQKDMAVSEVVDEAIIPKHNLAQQEPQVLQSQPGRMARIMREIARLQSSLPDGIFVRYAASRPDIMKILITGPKDTPYENGLFEFDLLCGIKFPHEPPKMDFKTTGGGRVAFNPNLYPEGKVCLSILGTWQGEPWNPTKSTLLQILVSIQAMIFCDNPWNNEPGRENTPDGDESSKAYNRGLYLHTVQTAMLDWLDRRRYTPPAPPRRGMSAPPSSPQISFLPREVHVSIDNTADMWDEVVKRHFEVAKDEILATVTKWVADKPPPPPAPRTAPAAPLPSWLVAHLHSASPLTQATNNATVNSSTFAGTGWQGRTLGSDEDTIRRNGTAAEPLVRGELATSLRGAVAILKKNVGRYDMQDYVE